MVVTAPAEGLDEVLNSRDKVLRAAEEEMREVVRVVAAAVFKDVESIPKTDFSGAKVTRSTIQGIVQNVFKDLSWVDSEENEIV